MSGYEPEQFADEVVAFFCGEPPAACPQCGRTGFYGPRCAADGRKYRMCKFCGYYQGVGEEAEQLVPCVHDCGRVPTVAGAPYITWVSPGARTFPCEHCGAKEAPVKGNVIRRPYDDAKHPWWKVPQDLSEGDYRAFWNANNATGRVYL